MPTQKKHRDVDHEVLEDALAGRHEGIRMGGYNWEKEHLGHPR